MDLFTVGSFRHIDKIDDDNASDVTQTELKGCLFYRLQVDLSDCVLKIRLTDIAPRVHIDHTQRFSLVDHDITTALEPNTPLERPLNLYLHTKVIKDRLGSAVEMNVGRTLGFECTDKVANPIEIRLPIHLDAIDRFIKKVTYSTDSQV